jgi:hypothetical protein
VSASHFHQQRLGERRDGERMSILRTSSKSDVRYPSPPSPSGLPPSLDLALSVCEERRIRDRRDRRDRVTRSGVRW